jgi:hypothetical protein
LPSEFVFDPELFRELFDVSFIHIAFGERNRNRDVFRFHGVPLWMPVLTVVLQDPGNREGDDKADIEIAEVAVNVTCF